MKKSKSRQHRAPSSKTNRLKRHRGFRRMEHLEARTLLAADAVSAWHNAALPGDVNADGEFNDTDIEVLVSELKQKSSLETPLAQLLEGEQALYLDVDNDGKVTSGDLLSAMEALMLEGEAASEDFEVDYSLVIEVNSTPTTEDDGTPAEVEFQQTFDLKIYVKDITDYNAVGGTPSDFVQAFVDVSFDPTKVRVVNPSGGGIQLGQYWNDGTGLTPANVTPQGALNPALDSQFVSSTGGNTLLWMGGTWNIGVTNPTFDDPTYGYLLATVQFEAIAPSDLDINDNPIPIEFGITPVTYEFAGSTPVVDPEQVAFNQQLRDGNFATGDENLVATYLDHPDASGLDVVKFMGGDVELIVNPPAPVAGANDDIYVLFEDYNENSVAGEDDETSTPPVFTIGGQKYYVFDVLANDRDSTNSNIDESDPQLTIVDADAIPVVDGEVSVLTVADLTDADELAQFATAGIDSNQVILYQLPGVEYSNTDGFTFSYQMSWTGTNPVTTAPDNMADVTVFVQPVDDLPTAEDFDVVVESGAPPVTVDILDPNDPKAYANEPGDTVTFDGFLNANDDDPFDTSLLDGTFVDLGNGQFSYESDMPGLEETVRYQVSINGQKPVIATITLKTLANTIVDGVVYFDPNNNGVWDDHADTHGVPEQRIGGVLVELLDVNGVAIADPSNPSEPYTVRTGADGSFKFNGIDAGDYRVRLVDPPFLRNGYTSLGGTLLNSDLEVDVTVDNTGTPLGLNWGFLGRDYQYIGRADTIASSINDSIVLAFSKENGVATLEWYSVNLGWDRLVQIQPDYAYLDLASKSMQVAYEVSVAGQDDPQFVVEAYSPSTAGYIVVAETDEGIIIRINGAAAEQMMNLAAVDAAFASL